LHAGWARKIERGLGERLASVAPSVWGERDASRADARSREQRGVGLGWAEQRRAAQKALALAQQARSVWTRADLLGYLGRVTPRVGMEPGAAVRLLEELADRILAGQLMGEVRHRALWRELTADEEAVAVAELRALAGGRADLLAEVAGIFEGASEGRHDEPRLAVRPTS
jgi:hypothetical protein